MTRRYDEGLGQASLAVSLIADGSQGDLKRPPKTVRRSAPTAGFLKLSAQTCYEHYGAHTCAHGAAPTAARTPYGRVSYLGVSHQAHAQRCNRVGIHRIGRLELVA